MLKQMVKERLEQDRTKFLRSFGLDEVLEIVFNAGVWIQYHAGRATQEMLPAELQMSYRRQIIEWAIEEHRANT